MGSTAQWDTDLGYRLYLEGKSDHEIADECRVNTGTVTSYRLKRWRKNPDGGRDAPLRRRMGMAPLSQQADSSPTLRAGEPLENDGKEVAGMSEEKKIDQKTETARMMEVIAKMTLGMGGILAVCVGNIIQSLWGLSSKQGIQDARNILDWLEENYDFG
jgi:hypothetical protein